MDRAQMEQAQKKAKEQFLMFTRVLMKYLENKDPQMHSRAKHVIRECAEKNKKKELGFESVTASMKTRLRSTVGEQYWKRAESYLTHFQQKMAERKSKGAAPGGTSSSSSSQQPPAQQAQQAAIQKQLAERQQNERRARERQAEQERLRKEADRKKAAADEAMRKQKQQNEATLRQHQEAAEKLSQIRQNTKTQMQSLKQQTEQQRVATATTTAATRMPKVDPAVAAAAKRKGSASPATSSMVPAAARTVRTMQDMEVPPREYSEFMEMVDHAVDYDWNSAGLLLGNKADIDLNAEQRKLLYGGAVPKISTDHKLRRGWNDRNIVSARTAWAKVRLPELEHELKESKSTTPVVAGMSLPSAKVDSTKIKTSWFNEDRAEADRTLAVLSEATEMYMKQVLDKALQCARQRENLDGIRLWHMQHSGSKPPIGLRLGCDVSRQVALTAGNAARTVQRMEEALERNPAEKRNLNDPEVVAEASSMGDLACRPKMGTAVENAAHQAKRSFETSGGKDANAPPFGRVPKQAKIMAHDFEMGMELTTRGPPRFAAFHFM